MEKDGQNGGTGFCDKQLATAAEKCMHCEKYDFVLDVHWLDCFLLIRNIRLLKPTSRVLFLFFIL